VQPAEVAVDTHHHVLCGSAQCDLRTHELKKIDDAASACSRRCCSFRSTGVIMQRFAKRLVALAMVIQIVPSAAFADRLVGVRRS
jgi:hypothetical protein